MTDILPSTLSCHLSALYFFSSSYKESESSESRCTDSYCQLDQGAQSHVGPRHWNNFK